MNASKTVSVVTIIARTTSIIQSQVNILLIIAAGWTRCPARRPKDPFGS